MNNTRIKQIILLIISTLLLMTMLPGCSGQEEEAVPDDTTITEDQSADGKQTTTDQSADGFPDIDISALGGDGVDVDLSKLSSTMVYSVVYDMMVRPNEYMGKKVRMTGTKASYYDENSGITYYACIIKDATACCAQGIEFQTTDEIDPADYPADDEPVTVSGIFGTYEENGQQYCVLKDAVLE